MTTPCNTFKALAALLIAAIAATQTAQAQQSRVQVMDSPMVTVPSGTVVPLSLLTPLMTLSTPPGSTIRAEVVFPITVGSQIAIPAGTVVEATVAPPPPKGKKQPKASDKLHFTRIVFTNGYAVPLDALQSKLTLPGAGLPGAAPAGLLLPASALLAAHVAAPVAMAAPAALAAATRVPQASTSTDPPASIHSGSTVTLALLVIAGAAILVGVTLLVHHHNVKKEAKTDREVLPAGLQLQMTLQAPLVLDVGEVTNAAGH